MTTPNCAKFKGEIENNEDKNRKRFLQPSQLSNVDFPALTCNRIFHAGQ